MLSSLKASNQRGDTIVEVLISIAIVSLILGGAYAATNQSQLGVRNSQEHAQALKLVESQLEQLRGSSADSSSQIFTLARPFCMTSSGATADASTAQCKVNSAGQPSTKQPAYSMSITRAVSNGGYLFSVTSKWDEVTGNSTAQEQMVYRIYK